MFETITLNKSHCAKESSCSVENDIDWRDINNPPTEVLMIPSSACQSQVFFTAAQRLVLGYCGSRGAAVRPLAFWTMLTSNSECHAAIYVLLDNLRIFESFSKLFGL